MLGARQERILPNLRYKAFISYSHAMDKALGPALRHGLQTFARPWNAVRACRVFLDQASVPVNSKLWSGIASALDESEYLILIGSPAAARSEWVNREVAHWRQARDPAGERILIVLTEGEIAWDAEAHDFDWQRTTALPRTVEKAFKEQPAFLDLRWAREAVDLSLGNVLFADAIASLAATLHGRPKDELAGKDIREQRLRTRAIRGTAAALALLVASLGVSLVSLSRTAEQEREQAAGKLLAQSAAHSARFDVQRSAEALALAHARAPGVVPLHRVIGELAGPISPAWQTVPPFDGMLESIEIAQSGTLGLGLTESGFRLWQLASGGVVHDFDVRPQAVYALSEDGRHAFFAIGKRLRILSKASGAEVAQSEDLGDDVRALTVSSGSPALVAAVTYRGELLLMDERANVLMRSERVALPMEGASVAFSRDGRRAGLVGARGERVECVVGDRCITPPVLEGVRSETAPVIGPDLAWAAFSARDHVRVIELTTGKVLSEYEAEGIRATASHPQRPWLYMQDVKSGPRRVDITGQEPDQRLAVPETRFLQSLRVTADGSRLVLLYDPRGFDPEDIMPRRLFGHERRSIVRVVDAVTGERAFEIPGLLDEPSAVAVSVDGGLIFTADRGGRLCTWTGEGALRGCGDVPGNGVIRLARSDDGRWLFSSRDGVPSSVRRWRLPDLTVDKEWPVKGPATQLAVSKDGAFVALGSPFGVQILTTASGAVQKVTVATDAARLVFVDGTRLLIASATGVLAVVDAATLNLVAQRKPAEGGSRRPTAAAMSLSGQQLFIGYVDGGLEVRDPVSLALVSEARLFDGAVVCLSPRSVDSTLLVAEGGSARGRRSEGRIGLWDPGAGDWIARARGSGQPLIAAALSGGGTLAATVGMDRGLRVWELGGVLRSRQFALSLGPVGWFPRVLQLAPDTGLALVSTAFSPGIPSQVVRLSDGKVLLALAGDESRLAFSPDGQWLIGRAASKDGKGRTNFWGLRSCEFRTLPFTGFGGYYVFSDDSSLVCASEAKRLECWDIVRQQPVDPVELPDQPVEGTLRVATGLSAIAYLSDGRVHVVDRKGIRLASRVSANVATFTAGGAALFVAGADSLVRWDFRTGEEKRGLPLLDLDWREAGTTVGDGSLVMTVSLETGMTVRQVATGETVLSAPVFGLQPPLRIWSTPSSHAVAIADINDTVRAWDLSALGAAVEAVRAPPREVLPRIQPQRVEPGRQGQPVVLRSPQFRGPDEAAPEPLGEGCQTTAGELDHLRAFFSAPLEGASPERRAERAERFAELAPEDPFAWVVLGESNAARGVWDAAYRAGRRAHELTTPGTPGRERTLYLLGYVAMSQGDIGAFEEAAMELKPRWTTLVDWHLALVQMLYFRGRYQEAHALARSALAMPDSPGLNPQTRSVLEKEEVALAAIRRALKHVTALPVAAAWFVESGGSAEKAGLRTGDLVVSVDEKRHPDPNFVFAAVSQAQPSAPRRLGILRDGERVTVELSSNPLGVFWRAAGPAVPIVRVRDVVPDDPLAAALLPGDILWEIDGKRAETAAVAGRMIAEKSTDRVLTFRRLVLDKLRFASPDPSKPSEWRHEQLRKTHPGGKLGVVLLNDWLPVPSVGPAGTAQAAATAE